MTSMCCLYFCHQQALLLVCGFMSRTLIAFSWMKFCWSFISFTKLSPVVQQLKRTSLFCFVFVCFFSFYLISEVSVSCYFFPEVDEVLPLGPRHRRPHQKKNWLCSIKVELRTRCRPHSDNLLTPALKTTSGSAAYILIDSLLSVKSIAEGGLSILQFGTVPLCTGPEKIKEFFLCSHLKTNTHQACFKKFYSKSPKAFKEWIQRLEPSLWVDTFSASTSCTEGSHSVGS